MEWLPIESSPKDGARILAATNEHDGPLIVSWRGKWPNGTTMAWRDDALEYDETYINITHWMPLPEPPK